jgi:hypothetical protein
MIHPLWTSWLARAPTRAAGRATWGATWGPTWRATGGPHWRGRAVCYTQVHIRVWQGTGGLLPHSELEPNAERRPTLEFCRRHGDCDNTMSLNPVLTGGLQSRGCQGTRGLQKRTLSNKSEPGPTPVIGRRQGDCEAQTHLVNAALHLHKEDCIEGTWNRCGQGESIGTGE